MSSKRITSRRYIQIDGVLSQIAVGYLRLNQHGEILFGKLDASLTRPDYDGAQLSGKQWTDVLPLQLMRALQPFVDKALTSGVSSGLSHSGFQINITPYRRQQFLLLFLGEKFVSSPSLVESFPAEYEMAATEFRIAIYDWEVANNLIRWTGGLSELFGYPEDLKTTSDDWWISRIHPDDRNNTLQAISSHFDQNRDFVVEYRFRGADGEYRIVLDRGRIMKPQGTTVHVIGTLIDISEQRRAEMIMRESERRYRGLVETMHEFVSELEPDGTLRFVNRTFQIATGYEYSELIGNHFLDLVHPKDQDYFRDKLDGLLQKHDSIRNCEFRLRKRDGTYFHLVSNADPIFDSQGKVHGVLQVSFDITERKRVESSMQLLTEVLVAASEAEDLHRVVSSSIENICKIGDWQAGQAWLIDPKDQSLFCSHSFYSAVDITEFRRESLHIRYEKGTGLPGHVWETMSPVFIENLSEQENSSRLLYANKCRLKSAFAFPLHFEGSLLAILEFFSTNPRTKEEKIFEIADKLGKYLGIALKRKTEQARLHHQAYHDVLTGLPNRILLQDRFAQALAHARRNQVMLSVLFIDLDEFKPVNDRLGHQVGDVVLRHVAKRIGACLRDFDTLARLGGDEFVVLLPDIQVIEDPAKVAQKILNLFDIPFRIEGHEIKLSTSIGISLYPLDGDSLQILMKNADMALYRAKEKGRNNYQLYTPAMTVTAVTRLKIEKDLRHAIERNELRLHYQPILELRSSNIVGVEALLRWQHPDMGLFLPAEFLPASEESGLISEIWRWALETACHQFQIWEKASISPEYLSMNIPSSVLREDVFGVVSDILNQVSFLPASLQLEVSEKLLAPSERITGALHDLRAMGIRLALDDFGTGASTILHLKRLPINTLKIDPVFIQSLAADTRDAALASALISLGHSLHLTVVAEGVETQEQLSFLRALNCDAIQGFLFCRPLSADLLTPLLEDGIQSP